MADITQPPEKQFKLELNTLQTDDSIPYVKVDVARGYRVNDDLAITFFQLNYQAIAEASEAETPTTQRVAIPMVKLVLSPTGFRQLRAMLDELASKSGLK